MSGDLTSWNADAYWPPELQRLQAALADLHMAASPRISSSARKLSRDRPMGSEPPGTGEPDQRRCRRKLSKTLALLARLASECDMTIRGPHDYRPPGRVSCPRCGRGQRISARYCDGCGGGLADRIEKP